MTATGNYCEGCQALLTDADEEAGRCTQCDQLLEPPTTILCCFCGKPTTWDVTYGDLCYRCIRADNE